MALWIRTKSGVLVNTEHVEAIEIDMVFSSIWLSLVSGNKVSVRIGSPEKMIDAMKTIGEAMATTGQVMFDTTPFE